MKMITKQEEKVYCKFHDHMIPMNKAVSVGEMGNGVIKCKESLK